MLNVEHIHDISFKKWSNTNETQRCEKTSTDNILTISQAIENFMKDEALCSNRETICCIVDSMLETNTHIIDSMKPDEELVKSFKEKRDKLDKLKHKLKEDKVEDIELERLKRELIEMSNEENEICELSYTYV